MTPTEELRARARTAEDALALYAICEDALFDALDAVNAELSRLRSPTAPVVGGVPSCTNLERNDQIRKYGGDPDFDAPIFQAGWDLCASRLPALKPGEVEALLRIESCVRSLRDCGPEYIGAEECRLLDRLDALRAQPTTPNQETPTCQANQ